MSTSQIKANIEAILADPDKVKLSKYLGLPEIVQQVQLKSDIERAIRLHEPRASVKEVQFAEGDIVVIWEPATTQPVINPPDVSNLNVDSAIERLIQWSIQGIIGMSGTEVALEKLLKERLIAAFESDSRINLLNCVIHPQGTGGFEVSVEVERLSPAQLKYDNISTYSASFLYG